MNDRILIIEDDEPLASTFRRFLMGAGYAVDVAGDYADGKELLARSSYAALFVDINLRGKLTGIDLLKEIRAIDRDIPVVIITGFPEVATAAEAVRNAAFDYLCKPIEKEQLLRVAKAAMQRKADNDEQKRQRENLEAVFRNVRDTLMTADLDGVSGGQNDTAPGMAAAPSATVPPRHSILSEREQQILAMLGQGDSNGDIASACGISARTVETYFSRMIDKLDLDGMKALRRHAIRELQQRSSIVKP